jgi:small conductance mechanosensitive channel
VLAVRPYMHTDHYWQVYFATNKAISDTFGAAGYAVPETRHRVAQAA